MNNPYQSPAFDSKQFRDQPAFAPPAAHDYGWVSQVRIFAILNAVQGVLEIPMGLFTTGMAVLFPTLMQMDKARNPNAGGPQPEEFMWFVSAIYLAIGIPVLTSGILRIIAAIRNYSFKGRTLGMVSICAGLGSMLSCYCAPTAIGLLVYGLILFLNPAVKAAFEMARQGHTPDQILAAFSPYQTTFYAPNPPPGAPGQPPLGGERPFGEM
jgi:uncharacterized membrane protein HdeD (DUF308 family)